MVPRQEKEHEARVVKANMSVYVIWFIFHKHLDLPPLLCRAAGCPGEVGLDTSQTEIAQSQGPGVTAAALVVMARDRNI